LYRYETWPGTLSKEQRFSISVTNAVKNIDLREKNDWGDWMKPCNEELHSLQSTPNAVGIHKAKGGRVGVVIRGTLTRPLKVFIT
jgi:hypothetical protein